MPCNMKKIVPAAAAAAAAAVPLRVDTMLKALDNLKYQIRIHLIRIQKAKANVLKSRKALYSDLSRDLN